MTSSPSSKTVATARRWQHRLGVGDWPVTFHASTNGTVNIQLGGAEDHVTIPADATEQHIVLTVLRYTFHNVPAHMQPTESELQLAADNITDAYANCDDEEDDR